MNSTGFLAPSEPAEILAHLRAARPAVLADVGCGSGGLGSWLARELGFARYIGIDRTVREQPSTAEKPEPTWLRQTFEALDLGELGPADAMISHDAVYLASDPVAALRRMQAGLAPRGRLVMTAYVGKDVMEGGVGGKSLADWLTMLEVSGGRAVAVDDLTHVWRELAGKLHRVRLTLCCRVHSPGAAVAGLAAISRRMLGQDGREAFLARTSRVRIVAEAGSLPPDKARPRGPGQGR